LWIEHGTVLPVFVFGLVVIPAVVWMAVTLPERKSYRSTLASQRQSLSQNGGVQLPALPSTRVFAVVGLAVAFRSLAHLSTVNFLPYIFQQKGWQPAEYGFITGVFWVASGLTGVWFGSMGDRYDSRRVILGSLLVAVPPIFLLPDLNGIIAILAALIIGASSGSHSLIVVLAQNLLPGRKGFASGAVLGFIFATGAVSNLIVGSLIDAFGAATAYHAIALVTLITSVLWLWLPVMNRRPPALEDQAAMDAVPEAVG
jgi:FSR family fosmidomycin resistance protein-like MFS transporter